MKRKIGHQNVLYPMPVTVVGALVKGKANFLNISHVGILNASPPHLLTLSMAKVHHTNAGIKENRTFSVNLVSTRQVEAADYVGLVSGKSTDKSAVFPVFYGELKTAPLIADCPLSMECRLRDIYDLASHDIMIGEVVATYADDAVLTEGEVDLAKAQPLLFDMGSRKYWSLGAPVADCWRVGRNYRG